MNLNFKNHKFILDSEYINNTDAYICKTCGIKFVNLDNDYVENNKEYAEYWHKHGYYGNRNELITCNEYIIKNIIE